MIEPCASFGDFVVGCERIIRGEAHRLARFGVYVPIDDAVQDGFVALLERERAFESYDGALARVIVRGHLENEYVRAPLAKKRNAPCVSLDGLLAPHLADHLPRICSHENDAIARATLAEIDRARPLPVSTGRTRQARHQRRQRWIRQVRQDLALVDLA